MTHVEDALEDPVVEPGLAHLVAVENRPHALPSLTQKAQQHAVRLRAVDAVEAMKYPGGPVDAEAALARAHAQPQLPPHIVEVEAATPACGVLEARARDQFALAYQLVILQ